MPAPYLPPKAEHTLLEGYVPKFGEAQGRAGGLLPIPPWLAQLPKNWDTPMLEAK